MDTKIIKTEVFHRRATLERIADDESNLVVASISSEEPYQRGFGLEILSHDPAHVDLGRVNRGTVPFLMDHNQEKFIGKVKSVRLDGTRALATIQMGGTDLARETLQEIKSGTWALANPKRPGGR